MLSLPDEYYYKDIDGKDAWRIGGYTMSESGYRFGGTAVGAGVAVGSGVGAT